MSNKILEKGEVGGVKRNVIDVNIKDLVIGVSSSGVPVNGGSGEPIDQLQCRGHPGCTSCMPLKENVLPEENYMCIFLEIAMLGHVCSVDRLVGLLELLERKRA